MISFFFWFNIFLTYDFFCLFPAFVLSPHDRSFVHFVHFQVHNSSNFIIFAVSFFFTRGVFETEEENPALVKS